MLFHPLQTQHQRENSILKVSLGGNLVIKPPKLMPASAAGFQLNQLIHR
jgi:hypothetical protein